MKKVTWGEKVDMLLVYPHITISQIKILLDVGQPSRVLAEKEGRFTGKRGVPTDLVVRVAGLDFDYFRNMAMKESVAKKGTIAKV